MTWYANTRNNFTLLASSQQNTPISTVELVIHTPHKCPVYLKDVVRKKLDKMEKDWVIE